MSKRKAQIGDLIRVSKAIGSEWDSYLTGEEIRGVHLIAGKEKETGILFFYAGGQKHLIDDEYDHEWFKYSIVSKVKDTLP